MGAQRIRVLIVDDQRLLRESFRKLIEMEPDFEVVGIASSGAEALRLAEQLRDQQQAPDVVLMDIRMPEMDGIAATQAFKTRWPDSHIVILTTFDDTELIQSGLRAGALGYLLKDISAEQLSMTIRMAAQGQMLLQPEIAQKAWTIPAAPPESHQESTGSQLTEREREILAMVARGASNREISEALYITGGTVKNHLSSIFGKLGVRDRTQAAIKAREMGL
ncbi:LuxR family two component transcriptional regulator [Thermosporothrix hazakensis]|jgi:DNA-binding NarL/FixJ family response regulator|uniref:LuxR family two component transcriptional regulator n=2 Tax=Thermosporothrix TaxID=768650 RepID=A0A326UQD6_THEHA|nr:response regulator transcription factor [Thermosporothrix hazakensis]PZW32737.1 LuxR family two component transcriptional regulator [Thermosporothrix hazakensis]BBH87652.1 DNA-binding response regulator [Thermosporothrix sp. COM3]GCE50095.1 DNA-binding response regulator [Thermosporothrix hazakensis]